MGELGRSWSKGTKLQLCRVNQSSDLLGSVTATLNKIVLSPGNWLREQISGAVITQKLGVDMLINFTVVILSLRISNRVYT